MPFAVVCAIYPLTCMEHLAEFKTLDHIPADPFPGLFALRREWQWDVLSQLFSCNRFQVIVKISSCQSVYPIQVCALMCPGIAPNGLQWDKPLLANGAGSP